jgi:uncharacterized membrane protein
MAGQHRPEYALTPFEYFRILDYGVLERLMTIATDTNFLPLRSLLCMVWVLLCVLVVGAPILAAQEYFAPSTFIYLVFSGVCHQIPERSFVLAGFPFAVCHRCSGIYLGFIAGSLMKNPFIYRSRRIRCSWIFASIAPLVLDVSLPFAGIAESTPLSRFTTGFLFGTMLSSLFLHGVRELLDKAPFHRLNSS